MVEIDDMKVVDLKAELKKLGLPVSGKKSELIDRLREALDSTNDAGADTGCADGASPPDDPTLSAPSESLAADDAKGSSDVATPKRDELLHTKADSAPTALAKPSETAPADANEPEAPGASSLDGSDAVGQVHADIANEDADRDAGKLQDAGPAVTDQRVSSPAKEAARAALFARDDDEDALSLGSDDDDDVPMHQVSSGSGHRVAMRSMSPSSPEQRGVVESQAANTSDPANDDQAGNDDEAGPQTKRQKVAPMDNAGPQAPSNQLSARGRGEKRAPIQSARVDKSPVKEPSKGRQGSAGASGRQEIPSEPAVLSQHARETSAAPSTGGNAQPSSGKRKRAQIVFDEELKATKTVVAAAPEKPKQPVVLVVPEAQGVTRALLIEGMRRPLREAELKALLEETGVLSKFWLASIKSHCYAVYETEEQAEATFKATDGKQWPDNWQSIMRPMYVTEEEADAVVSATGPVTVQRGPGSSAPVADVKVTASKRLSDHDALARTRAPSGDLVRSADRAPILARVQSAQRSVGGSPASPGAAPHAGPGAGQGALTGDAMQKAGRGSGARDASNSKAANMQADDEPIVDLSMLFKKTTTRPAVYWLPLTEDQVKAKRTAAQAINA